MKKLVVLLIVLVGLWVGVNYMRTGQIGLMPSSMSPEEQHVQDLQKQLDEISAEMTRAGQTAGMTGMDTTHDVSALLVKKEKIEKELQEARKKLR